MTPGIAQQTMLPDPSFNQAWDAIKIADQVRKRLVNQALLGLSIRPKVAFEVAPLHGLIVLAGPPGTGKTTLARGLASQVAAALPGQRVVFIQVDPHALASASLGKSQQAATKLFDQTIPEAAQGGCGVVLLDEVETLAADRQRMSLEANPVDVHRATDAVLAGVDLLTRKHRNVLLIATTNYPQAVDPAFMSRADLIEMIPPPNAEARAEIIRDTLMGLAKSWPGVGGLVSHVNAFAAASDGLDGRRLRKAVVGAAALELETAKDPGKMNAQQVLASLQQAKRNAKEAGREAA
ncbi:AAA family ATPase [Phenylobacterium soli]|uniref:ATP-binding protein n=1 Tax=Phenylobacterium soli TaxID=2170551 RepID=A0A328ALM0_9CAUL|nr:AAA family ATPase [Phenylobacterium soli]RAK54906.1 ATP-binding protein [Phenylobacterium soli]